MLMLITAGILVVVDGILDLNTSYVNVNQTMEVFINRIEELFKYILC